MMETSLPVSCPILNDPFSQNYQGEKKAIYKLLVAIVLCLVFLVAELVGGYLSGSLAIITDAAHLMSDIAGFLVSLFALTWSRKRASASMSYGYHRAEILGALLSISLVWAMTFWLIIEAIERVRNPQPVDGKLMFVVALLGVAVNAIIGFVLHEHHHDHCHEEEEVVNGVHISSDRRNINLRAAFIHAIGDLIQSLGVLFAASLILWKPEWKLADPICTFFFSILVIFSTWFLARDTIHILMEGTPHGVVPQELQRKLASLDGVLEVHDLHVWSLAPGKISATVHIVIDWSNQQSDKNYYHWIINQCQNVICSHNIHHATIQIDPDRYLDVHCRSHCCGSQENVLSNENRPA